MTTTLSSSWPLTFAEFRNLPTHSSEPRELQESFGSGLPKVEFLCKIMWGLLEHGSRHNQREFLKNITRSEYDEMINHEFEPIRSNAGIHDFALYEFDLVETIQGFGYWSAVFDEIFVDDDEEEHDDLDEIDFGDYYDDDDDDEDYFDTSEFPEFIV